jgi:hypothetical protein
MTANTTTATLTTYVVPFLGGPNGDIARVNTFGSLAKATEALTADTLGIVAKVVRTIAVGDKVVVHAYQVNRAAIVEAVSGTRIDADYLRRQPTTKEPMGLREVRTFTATAVMLSDAEVDLVHAGVNATEGRATITIVTPGAEAPVEVAEVPATEVAEVVEVEAPVEVVEAPTAPAAGAFTTKRVDGKTYVLDATGTVCSRGFGHTSKALALIAKFTTEAA